MASWATKIPARFIDFGNKVLRSDNYVFGIKLVADGGGSGTWMYIDENENIVDLPDRYFEGHPTYKGITEVSYDGGLVCMVKFPKFYIRTANGDKIWIAPDPTSATNTQEENERLVEDLKERGFRLHPAFLTGYTNEGSKKEYDCFYVGAYPLSKNANGIAESKGDTKALIEDNIEQYSVYCNNRNIGGVAGYHMWTIYELSAIQLLALLECKTTNFQKKYGAGRVNSTEIGMNNDTSANTGPASAKYRGVYCLWGNAWQLVDGIKTDSNNNLLLWAGDGRRDENEKRLYGTTDIKLPSKTSDTVTYAEGVTSGYYNRPLTDVGARYNCSDMFLPDFTTLTGRMELGTYSDYVYCPAGTIETLCAVGGYYNSGDEAGLFAYNFNINPSQRYDSVTSRLAKYDF